MTMTIIKTGCVLRILGQDWDLPSDTAGNEPARSLYGDLHTVGNNCIMYYPLGQMDRNTVHGVVDLREDPRRMVRNTQPFGFMSIKAEYITMVEDSLHEIDRETFILAGGKLVATREELEEMFNDKQ